eukprot:1157904-Pelagomonas_calceolata.AAC.1
MQAQHHRQMTMCPKATSRSTAHCTGKAGQRHMMLMTGLLTPFGRCGSLPTSGVIQIVTQSLH